VRNPLHGKVHWFSMKHYKTISKFCKGLLDRLICILAGLGNASFVRNPLLWRVPWFYMKQSILKKLSYVMGVEDISRVMEVKNQTDVIIVGCRLH